MNDARLEVDSSEVQRLFANLTSREQKKVYKRTIRKSANILVREARKQLKAVIGRKINSRNWWNGKTLGSGIKVSVSKDNIPEAKVHIMSDFRLKFFELGTNERRLKKEPRKGAYRGKITASYFFKKSKANKEREIFDNMEREISQQIYRISNRL